MINLLAQFGRHFCDSQIERNAGAFPSRLVSTAIACGTVSGRRIRRFDKPAIVIGGCGRSGTTLLASILSAIPEVFVVPFETNCLIRRYGTFPSMEANLGRLYVTLLFHHIQPMVRRWCEKTPRNVRVFPELLRTMGDNVRIINLIRDGRDVVTSRHEKRPNEYWVSIDRWVHDVEAGLRVADDPRVYTLRYEHLVSTFDKAIADLCTFLDVPPEQVPKRDWHINASVRGTDKWAFALKPVHRGSMRKWDKPEHSHRISEFLSDIRAQTLMRQLGYEC